MSAVSIPRLPVGVPAEDVAAALHDAGAVIVEDVLSRDVLTRFNAELDPILEA